MQDWHLISSYAGLLALAVGSVYAGSFGSLKGPRPTAKGDADDDEDEEDVPDRLTSEDAYLFPVLGSVVLVGLYLVVKFLGTEWINWFLAHYFTLTGVVSVWKCSVAVAKRIAGKTRWHSFSKFKIVATKDANVLSSISMRTPTLLLFVPSLIPSALYAFLPGDKKSAFLTDILALSFSHNALSLLKLDSFKTGMILLSGLFLYDIWWVFGTEVMVKVATSLDIPIKILWPKSYLFLTERGFTMLGLGDIVIPGTFVSTALRYDLSRSAHQTPGLTYAKPYFYAAVTSYAVGLITTMVVMHTFGAAQPALLYLSPACIFSFLITATLRGELKDALAWSDDQESDKKEESKSDAEEQPKSEDNPSAVETSALSKDSHSVQHPIAAPDDPPNGGEGSGPSLRRSTRKGRKP